MPIVQYEVIEILSSSRSDTRGRVLLLGVEDKNLKRSIDNDIALKKRFGTYGLCQNDRPKSFGIPIISGGINKYYMIATFLDGERAVPFRGCLIEVEQLRNSNCNLLGFLHAWENFLKKGKSVDLTIHIPGKIILEVVTSDQEKKGLVGKENLVDALESEKILRFFSEDKAIYFIELLLSNESLMFKYSWTTAPFEFPREPDGAKFHIAVAPDSNRYKDLSNDVIVKDDCFIGNSGENNVIGPIELEIYDSELSSLNKPVAIHERNLKKNFKYALVFLFCISFIILIFNIIGNNSVKNEEWLKRNLGEVSFRQPLLEQIDAVFFAKQVLENSTHNSDQNVICKRLVGPKILKVQEILVDSIRSEWKFLDRYEIQVKKWFEIVKSIGKIDIYNKPNIEDYKKEIVRVAKTGLEKFIQEQNKPDESAVKKLDYALSVAEKYPEEFIDLISEARLFSNWLKTEIEIQRVWPKRNDYGSFRYINDLLAKALPPDDSKLRYLELKSNNIRDWLNFQAPLTKSLYNEMIDGKINFSWSELSMNFENLLNIPEKESNSFASGLYEILKNIEKGKVIYLKVISFSFSDYFKNELRLYRLENEEEEILVHLKTYSPEGDVKDFSIDGNISILPVILTFSSNSSLQIYINSLKVGYLNLRPDLFEYWIKNQGKRDTLIFKTNKEQEIIKCEYLIPTISQIGLPMWN